MKMRFLVCASIVLASFGFTEAVEAAVVIDPTTGWTGNFSWNDGLGQIDGIGSTSENEWALALTAPGTMSLVTGYDDYVVGDEFALYVDGTLTPWTQEYYDSSGYYHGEHDSLALSAGSHTITFYVTALAPGYSTGGAHAIFSEVTTSAVPEPTTLAIWSALGSLGLIAARRRRKAA